MSGGPLGECWFCGCFPHRSGNCRCPCHSSLASELIPLPKRPAGTDKENHDG